MLLILTVLKRLVWLLLLILSLKSLRMTKLRLLIVLIGLPKRWTLIYSCIPLDRVLRRIVNRILKSRLISIKLSVTSQRRLRTEKVLILNHALLLTRWAIRKSSGWLNFFLIQWRLSIDRFLRVIRWGFIREGNWPGWLRLHTLHFKLLVLVTSWLLI